ncbi:MAG: hypothetical protein RIA65_05675, partial [Woeseia sp.]
MKQLHHPRVVRTAANKTMNFSFILLIAMLFPLQAAGNVWLDTYGDKWFYEVRVPAGEVMAGNWSNPAL